MSAKRSDTATEADWSFLTDEVKTGLDARARALAVRFSVESDELVNEVCLWLAVRPGSWDTSTVKGRNYLMWRAGEQMFVYASGIQAKLDRLEPLDPYEDSED